MIGQNRLPRWSNWIPVTELPVTQYPRTVWVYLAEACARVQRQPQVLSRTRTATPQQSIQQRLRAAAIRLTDRVSSPSTLPPRRTTGLQVSAEEKPALPAEIPTRRTNREREKSTRR